MNGDNLQYLPMVGFMVGCAGSGLLLMIILIIYAVFRIRRIPIPEGAGFFEALRLTPLIIVVTLDLMDFFFDFLSAPIAWTFLTYLGLAPLRTVSVVEGLIPGTQIIPTMTICWLLARYTRLGENQIPWTR